VRTRNISLFFAAALALTGAAAVAFSPIPPAYAAIIPLAAVCGLAWDLRSSHFIPRIVLTLVGAAGFLFTLLPFNRETLAEQSLAALTILLSVKLLEEKARRDHLQILALSAILTVGAGSLAPELVFGTLILLVCVLGTFFLVWLPFSEAWRPGGEKPGLLRRISAVSGGLILLALPLAFVLFIVLPRSVNPFWRGLAPGQKKVSGFSEEISLGQVGEIAVSREIAFRAEMISPSAPLAEIPYWRGTVMEQTDGLNWSATMESVSHRGYDPGEGVRINYYVEPHGERQLFLLEQATAATIGLRPRPLSNARTLRLRSPLYRRIRYQGVSQPLATRPGKLSGEAKRRALQLPEDFSPRIRDLAGDLARGSENPREVSRRMLAFFGRDFSYTLEVPPPGGDPLEEFLFEHRSGYCEYFASSLALLLRAAGVPARVVAGYLGGEYNDNGNYYLVTQAAAHTWVEAWLGEEGWTRLDPTPAAQELGGTMASREYPPRLLWLDSLRMKWNSWVVQYDAEVQVGLVRKGARTLFRFRLPRPATRELPRYLPWLLFPALFLLWKWGRGLRRRDALARRWDLFTSLMARRGVERRAWEGPLDFTLRAAAVLPGAEGEARAFAQEYARLRYGRETVTPEEVEGLDVLLTRLRVRLGAGPS
jgi:transglutaminase-like putative cysteine protease